MIYELIALIVLWLPLWYLHEVCHGLESWRQTGDFGIITFKPHKLIITHSATIPLKNGDLVGLAGGLYSGIILFLLSLLSLPLQIGVITYPLLIVGVMNLAYGPFEMLYWAKNYYRLGRYTIYLVVWIIITATYWVIT